MAKRGYGYLGGSYQHRTIAVVVTAVPLPNGSNQAVILVAVQKGFKLGNILMFLLDGHWLLWWSDC